MIPGMAAIGLYKLLKSGDISSLKIKDLRLMEIKLNKKIDELNEETKDITESIKNLFEKARETKTKSEEITIANRIKTLNQKKDMKQSAVVQLEKELRGVSNLLILKENERDLKESGAWKKLEKMKPEKMEKWLTSKTLEQRNRQAVISDIVSMTSEAMESVDYDEDLDEILGIIREVKIGDIESEEASKKVMKEKKEKEA
jgi:CBS-domain-containing membrane protein